MIRVLIYLAAVLAAAFGAVWLVNQSGDVSMVFGDTRYQVSLPVAVVALVVLVAAIMFVWKLVTITIHGPEAISGLVRSRRKKKGIRAVTRALVAAGVGDARSARRAARDAERLLPGDPLARLVEAQAAQLSGDGPAASRAFQAMADLPETRALGLRGLYVEARRRGDAMTARTLAEEALSTTPDAPWAGPALLEFQCAARDWAGALSTVERNAAAKTVTRPQAKRQRAVLLTAMAADQADADSQRAIATALDAVRLAPDLVPAAALAARLLAESGDPRRAAKVAEAAWKRSPHPDLAEAYLRARPGDTAQDRLKRARMLASKAPGHPESLMELAGAARDAREFELARSTLAPLVEKGATVRVCVLMAEIEEAEHGDRAAARGWLARALTAPRDAAWIGDGMILAEWQPVGPRSGTLDAVEWREPVETLASAHMPVLDAALEPEPEPDMSAALVIAQGPMPLEQPLPKPIVVPAPAEPAAEPETSPAAVADAAREPVATEQPRSDAGQAAAGPDPARRPQPKLEIVPEVDLPPPPDDPGPGGDPLEDEGRPPLRAPVAGPP